jgi:SAM-dependent methyltransferase
MDRITWLQQMRHGCEEQYDRESSLYDQEGGTYSNVAHQRFIGEFLGLLPEKSKLLDAPCGTGRYLPFLLAKGHSVIGIDQSQGMLSRAEGKFPAVQFEKLGLQEMAYSEIFDGAICMDAMENIAPEDWPLVLGNFHRALKPHGYFYFTVETIEMADENEILRAFERAQQAGLPVVYGEYPDEVPYHYHPTTQQVREWTRQAGFEILQDGNGEIWYFHVLVQKA